MPLPRLSLTTRIFLSSAGIVIVIMAVVLVVTQQRARSAAEASIGRELAGTVELVRQLVESERAQLASRARVFAESPEYRSSFENSKEPGQYLDYAETAQEQIGAQWTQLISREGIRLAKSDAPSAPADTLLESPLVRQALEKQTAQGFGVAGDSTLIETVAVPILGAGGRVIGALMAAKYVTDSIARAVGSQTQSAVLFFALDAHDEPRLAAATEDIRGSSGALLTQLSQRLHSDSNGVQQAGRAPDSANAVPSEPIELNGEHFVSRRAVLRSASGDPAGGFVAMRSLEKELAATGYTQLRNTLLVLGAGGLLVALLFSGLTARQVARPVRLLADASRRAAEGDYQAVIPEGGRDEIGTLASAFRRLLADLKDKQALVDFLSVAAPGATRTQMLTVTPTMKLQMGNITMLEPGQTLGNRYEIKSVLGVGGMGMVYKANDKELGESVAIKTLKPEMSADSNALERFKSEIKLARRISHRNVVRTYDLGEINGLYYLTMEYVEGKSLKDLVRERGRLPASVVLPIAKQLCRALEVAHDEGVIHRDIKPQNMVVQADGVLKVMDFGIARLATRPQGAGHTEAGMVVGTPEYMAPEQLLGDELDARADLYAVGAVLYECLVGDVPLTADTPITLIAKVLDEEPKRPSSLQPDIPVALSDLVMWVLAKDRENRPRSAAELHARLDQIALA
jgi:HAMP domain-containing protein/predicted Ser/Thr protein kinase